MKNNESLINNERINQEKIEKNNNFLNDTETIILIIIDKIIKNVIHKQDKKKIYNNLDNYCFNYIKNNINLLLKTKFFYHEDGLGQKKENILFDHNINKFDKWIKIEEPLIPNIDRNNSNKR